MASIPSLERLPTCVKCERSLLQVETFLVLSCEDVICSACTNVNKKQAFCQRHAQQSLGQYLEDAVQDLHSLQNLLSQEPRRSQDTAGAKELERLSEQILTKLKLSHARMGKFREKSRKFNTAIEEDSNHQRLAEIQNKFKDVYTFKSKGKEELLTQAPPPDENFIVCKICFRINEEEAKTCPGCKNRDYKIVWLCRGCHTRNQNGMVRCQQCHREDEYQVQLFRKRPTVI